MYIIKFNGTICTFYFFSSSVTFRILSCAILCSQFSKFDIPLISVIKVMFVFIHLYFPDATQEDILFKRIVHPSFNPREHVTKLGIRLRTTSISDSPHRPSTPSNTRMISAKSRLSARSKSSASRFTPQTNNVKHIYNMVVPVSCSCSFVYSV